MAAVCARAALVSVARRLVILVRLIFTNPTRGDLISFSCAAIGYTGETEPRHDESR